MTAHVDDLLVQIAHGSRNALAELYDLLAPLLLALLRSREGSMERAHGELIDAFARIWRRAPSYEPGHGGLEWVLDQASCTDAPARAT
ncbi:hypothetical protein [Streptomyces sp. RTGN2]|uniref:hypothetical protein n=1 Tax=Streptomyces sp. RTGN2 TaxID=3016525 RepID=UPI0025546644|nr:hypothetical protein [Streptomyces sp. RTGN2]